MYKCSIMVHTYVRSNRGSALSVCTSCSELGRVDSNVYDATAKVFIILWTFPPSSLAIAVLTVSCVHRGVCNKGYYH